MLLAATPLIKKKCIFAQLMSHVVFSSMEEIEDVLATVKGT